MAEEILKIQDLKVRYSRVPVLHGVSMIVEKGETVCLLGSNGAGKTTLLRAIMASQKAYEGKIIFEGREIQALETEEIVRMGLVYVPEEKMLFGPMSVEENLLLGAYTVQDPAEVKANLEAIYALFPVLAERRSQPASTLSGGEQQMVAIGRGLMSNPKVLMLDEPSLGLAPILVDEVFETIKRLQQRSITILLVEQNVREALELAHRGYVLQTGRIVLEGRADELMGSEMFRTAFLGI